MPYLGDYKELPEGHPFKGAHVFFTPRPQASAEKNSTEPSPQENLVQALKDRGGQVNVFSKEELHKRQNDNLKSGEWPRG